MELQATGVTTDLEFAHLNDRVVARSKEEAVVVPAEISRIVFDSENYVVVVAEVNRNRNRG